MNTFKFNNSFIPLIESLYTNEFCFEKSLDHIHELLESSNLKEQDKKSMSTMKHIGIDDRNTILINKYHEYVDKEPLFMETYKKFIDENIRPLFPNEKSLVIQKTPNLRISFPNLTAIGKYKNDTHGIIGLHCDSDFGHFHKEINVIVPLTKMFDTNSIYYEPFVDSNIDLNKYNHIELDETEFGLIYLNKLKHYNRQNQTGLTRMSFDLRVIPYSEYSKNIDFFKNTKFELGNYFIKY